MGINYDKQNKKTSGLARKLKESHDEIAKLKSQNFLITQTLHGTLHEVRRFSAEISEYSEQLNRYIEASDYKYCNELSKTILYTSGLISSRLAFTDIELNPKAVSLQTQISASIFKKFEKASHILKQRARSKQINIHFQNNSYLEIDALPSFELVPFVILENSVKYSPNNQIVNVLFDESPDKRNLSVTVSSVGPSLELHETPYIFDRGFRGGNAKKMPVAGDGLGLFLVKFLCDYHDINIHASMDNQTSYSFNGIPYGNFHLRLTFVK